MAPPTAHEPGAEPGPRARPVRETRPPDPRGRPPVLEVRGLWKSFGATRALAGVSLSVAPGEFVALLGPSGCGKTTLLNLVAGFLEADAGEIWLQGALVNRLAPYHRATAMVFQSYALFPHLDVFANIAFGLRMRRVARPEIRQRVLRMAAMVRLGDMLHRYPSQLSGGQQQRVALARALIVEPAVLLLDEPLSNLDAKLREGLRDEVRVVQRQLGITAVFVTHDQDEAMAMCDRVFVMQAGQIEQVGTPREIYEAPQTPFVAGFIGTFNAFDGEIASVDPSHDEFEPRSGCRLPLPHAPDRVPGLKGRLLIRPERLRLAAEPIAGARGLPGVVVRATFLGTHLRYIVESAGHVVTVDDPRYQEGEFRPGDEVWVILPPDPLFLPEGR